MNRIAWRIHELDPALSPGVLNYPKHRDVLREWLTGQSVIVAELALQELADITRLTEDIDALEKRITARVREVAPCLFGMPGCGALTAARIVGETALVTRFSAEPAFAQYAGLAPVPQWSGSTAGRMRRPKYGNRQLNSAVHRIAVTQLRLDGPGRAYYRKRLAEANDTRAMALRGTQTPSRPCGLRTSARGLSQQATPLAGAPDGLIIRLIGTEHAAHQKISHDLDHAGAIMPICSQAYRSRRLWRPHCLQRGRRWWLRWSHTPIRVQRSVPAISYQAWCSRTEF